MTFEDYVREHLDRANPSHKGLELVRMGWNARGKYGQDAMEHGELHEPMTAEFKASWKNGLPLDSMEAKWAFVGWQAARAQGGEAVPDGYAVAGSEGEFHFMIERGDYPEDSLFLCREHINDSESEGLDEGLEIKAVFMRKLTSEHKTVAVPK